MGVGRFLSYQLFDTGLMKNSKPRPLVTLEPDLELQVITLSPGQRRALAKLYLRWSHQLLVSAQILEQASKQPVRRQLRFVSPQKAALN